MQHADYFKSVTTVYSRLCDQRGILSSVEIEICYHNYGRYNRCVMLIWNTDEIAFILIHMNIEETVIADVRKTYIDNEVSSCVGLHCVMH